MPHENLHVHVGSLRLLLVASADDIKKKFFTFKNHNGLIAALYFGNSGGGARGSQGDHPPV